MESRLGARTGLRSRASRAWCESWRLLVTCMMAAWKWDATRVSAKLEGWYCNRSLELTRGIAEGTFASHAQSRTGLGANDNGRIRLTLNLGIA